LKVVDIERRMIGIELITIALDVGEVLLITSSGWCIKLRGRNRDYLR